MNGDTDANKVSAAIAVTVVRICHSTEEHSAVVLATHIGKRLSPLLYDSIVWTRSMVHVGIASEGVAFSMPGKASELPRDL